MMLKSDCPLSLHHETFLSDIVYARLGSIQTAICIAIANSNLSTILSPVHRKTSPDNNDDTRVCTTPEPVLCSAMCATGLCVHSSNS